MTKKETANYFKTIHSNVTKKKEKSHTNLPVPKEGKDLEVGRKYTQVELLE